MRILVPALFLIASLAPAFAAAEGEDRRLQALFDEAWAFRLAEDPLFATSAGDHRYDDRLPSMTHADLERRAAYARSALERLKAIDRAALSPSDRVSADMFARELQDSLADFEFGAYRIPINADSGFHTDFADLPDRMPFATTKDYENYIARLNAFPAYVGEEIALMREGIAARLHAAAGRARGLRRHDDDPRRRGPGEERLLRAVPGVSAGGAGGGARAADRGRPPRGHAGGRRGLPDARRLHDDGVRAARAR